MMGQMFGNGYYGGNWEGMPDYMKNMMQSYWGGVGPFLGIVGILELVKEILVIILVVAAIRYFWNKGGIR